MVHKICAPRPTLNYLLYTQRNVFHIFPSNSTEYNLIEIFLYRLEPNGNLAWIYRKENLSTKIYPIFPSNLKRNGIFYPGMQTNLALFDQQILNIYTYIYISIYIFIYKLFISICLNKFDT